MADTTRSNGRGINLGRQEALGLQLPQAAAVVGCGGVGSWTAFFLAMAGVPELWLWDMDTISDHNLNRVPVPASAINQPKSEAVRDMIHIFRPDCKIISMGAFSPETADSLDLKDSIQWIVATTDTAASRRRTSQWAADNGVSYIEAAAEGEIGSATGEPAGWSTPDEVNPGYASVPVWVGSSVFSAAMAVAHIVHNTPMGDRTIRMGWSDGMLRIFDSGISLARTAGTQE